VVQALTLTDIVVGVTVVGLLLALTIVARRHACTTDPDKLHAVRG
jgi:multicomponent Na+:H+ antiporter subunit C